jgi:hypothetical protein
MAEESIGMVWDIFIEELNIEDTFSYETYTQYPLSCLAKFSAFFV